MAEPTKPTKPVKPVDGGVLAAVLTPIKQDLAPDHETYVEHCRWLLDEGCDGLAVLGTTSEANSFSVAERLGLLDALADGGIPGPLLIPGTGCCAIPDTVTLTRKALEIGAAGVLMLPPFYYKPVSDDGLFAAYSEIIQRVADPRLRIYLYHIPQNSGVPITFGLIKKLLKAWPGIVVGIKDSAGDFSNMKNMVDSFPGFRVLSGSDAFLLELLRAGGAGAITACNNVTTSLSTRVYANWRSGEADAYQNMLGKVREIISSFPLVPALRALTAHRTGKESWRAPRPPLEPLGAGETARLIEQLASVGFSVR
jgi:4-hydroxy-tetrahydrodipicolinate synthase